jgi:hypothetical protein
MIEVVRMAFASYYSLDKKMASGYTHFVFEAERRESKGLGRLRDIPFFIASLPPYVTVFLFRPSAPSVVKLSLPKDPQMTTRRSETTTPDLCQFSFADGRLCRMLRSKDHLTLCLFHARQEGELVESQHRVTELPAFLNGNFHTVADVHGVLRKLFTARARNNISQRDAATLAYIAQLMLQSISHAKREAKLADNYKLWESIVHQGILPSDFQLGVESTAQNY